MGSNCVGDSGSYSVIWAIVDVSSYEFRVYKILTPVHRYGSTQRRNATTLFIGTFPIDALPAFLGGCVSSMVQSERTEGWLRRTTNREVQAS